MHNFVYLAQRRSQKFSCEPNFGGGACPRPPPLAAPVSRLVILEANIVCVAHVCVRQIDIRYATIVEPDFTLRIHLVGFFIATVSYPSSPSMQKSCNHILVQKHATANAQHPFDYGNSVLFGATQNKKLSYRRGTARCVVSVEICQFQRNSAETTYITSPDQIDVMKLEI